MTAQTLSLSDGTIAFDDTGRGPLVVCVPGMGDVRGAFRFLAPRLAAEGFRVVSMDPRGHGETSARWPEYSVDGIGRDILALLRHLDGGPAVLVGHSINAASVIWAAAEAPDLVRGLVLLDPAVHGDMPSSMRPLVKALFSRPWGPAAWILYFTRLFPTRKPDDFATYTAALKRNLSEPGRIEALYAMMLATRAPAEARISQVRAPALALMGTKDGDFPDPEGAARRIAEELGGRYAMIAGAGHYPHVEMPEATLPLVVDFVKSVQPEGARAAAAGG